MREIKFRGLAGAGYWVVGSLFINEKSHAYVVHPDETRTPVSPDTVGQFTGLKDKFAKEVYEGDILQQYGGVLGKTMIGIPRLIEFSPDYGWLTHFREGDNIRDYFEVIGNIYENKELLK